MTLHANTVVKAPSPHKAIVEGDEIGHHSGDQRLSIHKSGFYTQTRKDTTGSIPGEPDFVHPDDKGPLSMANIK